ncbi:MAG: hypothetical protein IJT58_00950 [Synergistaceae bacterium]|nr:hypothetical protein [Synergistaceae bacterium]
MSVIYPDDYPWDEDEALEAAMAVRDEDIDFSDIPEATAADLARAVPVGDRFKEMGRRNIAFLNKLFREYDERHSQKTNS